MESTNIYNNIQDHKFIPQIVIFFSNLKSCWQTDTTWLWSPGNCQNSKQIRLQPKCSRCRLHGSWRKKHPSNHQHPTTSDGIFFWRCHYCHTVDGSEILHQLTGSLSHYLQGFIYARWLARFLPSTLLRSYCDLIVISCSFFAVISRIPERVPLGFMFGIVMNFHWESWERFNKFVLDSVFSLDFLFCVVCIRISWACASQTTPSYSRVTPTSWQIPKSFPFSSTQNAKISRIQHGKVKTCKTNPRVKTPGCFFLMDLITWH